MLIWGKQESWHRLNATTERISCYIEHHNQLKIFFVRKQKEQKKHKWGQAYKEAGEIKTKLQTDSMILCLQI